MRATRPSVLLALGLGAAALACASPFAAKETVSPAPAPVAPPPPAPPEPAAAVESASWPILKLDAIAGGRSVGAPGTILDLDVDPTGRFAAVVVGVGDATSLWTWDFVGALVPVPIDGVREVAFSPFDGALYVVTRGPSWTVTRGSLAPGGPYTVESAVYTSDSALSALVAPYTRYDDEDRVFFARETAPGRTQILSVRRSSARAYEVTSPTGALGELTAAELRTPPADSYTSPPRPLAAESASPLSVHPATGALLWRDAAGAAHTRAWDIATGNWSDDAVTGAPGEVWTWSPNGYYAIGWTPGAAGVRYRAPDGTIEAVSGPTFDAAPVSAANGRTLVGWVGSSVVTLAVPLPLAPVRYLTAGGISDARRAAIAREGIAVEESAQTQLYGVYDDILYGSPERPVFASVDGMLEVLHVGFQAVFVRVEREVSRPRLDAFLGALEAAALKSGEKRVREIATAAKRMLAGDYAFPEGERARAGVLAESELHRMQVDFQDFRPRGPYATSPELENYFRAFKYINLLQLTDEERRSLVPPVRDDEGGIDPALLAAWKAWVDAQSPYLSGTRYDGMFGDVWEKTPYVRPECLPTSIRRAPRRVFPLSWGRDSEILERTVAHDDLDASCTVPERTMPSGLDLLTAFGSPSAAAFQRAEYARYPTLEPTHAALRARFSGDISSERFVDAWMRLVQILGNDTRVPEGVTAARWQSRLLETALASWTSFRHTTVLVNEGTAAQMGDGGDEIFEAITTEPIRGVVDPVPAAWAQTATLLDALATAARATPATDRLAEVLAEGSTNAARLGELARKQMADTPLTEPDYEFIAAFAGVVEHPYLLLSAVAAGKPDELAAPEPMMRIVDIHTWNDPNGPPAYWHAAVGAPREVTVLLGDRGVLVPGSGAVYGYHEVVADHRLDDAEWRGVVGGAARPAWANPSLR